MKRFYFPKWQGKINPLSRRAFYFLDAEASLFLAVPLAFFILFFLSLRCFLAVLLNSITPCLASLYLGSNLLARAKLSYIKANPVVLPPPKFVLNPKANAILAGLVHFSKFFSN